MDYRSHLDALVRRLVGRRIERVRYDVMTCDVWDEFGPAVDVQVDSLLIDLDGDEPAFVTWSSASGFCYGLSIAFASHWVDEPGPDRGELWATLDVTTSSRWREVVGEPIAEARVNWDTVVTEEFPPEAISRTPDGMYLDRSKTLPSTIASPPQEFVLRFANGRWLVLSAARYHGEGKGFWTAMDEVIVVHDEAFMRRNRMGPYVEEAQA